MLTSQAFEELLATYPVEKRELARQVYCRFADGDSTQFFTQLFIVLDVYARYAERVPQAVIEANQSAHAGLDKVREQIGLLAQALDKRNLNIANHAEQTDELCRAAAAKCDETIARFQSLLKDIGAQVDTKAIVAGVQKKLETDINDQIISPFVSRSEELATQVLPTLAQIRDAANEASRLWPGRIWKTAWTTSLSWSVLAAVVFTCLFCWKFAAYYDGKMAEQIANTAQVMNLNEEAFRQLAIAQVPAKIVPVQSDNGKINPQCFALVIEGARAAEMRQVNGQNAGCIFFDTSVPAKQLQRLRRESQSVTQPTRDAAK